MGDASDEQLMAQVQAGDHDAFASLVARHLTGLHRFAQRLLRNTADAEDVAQEALLRVWQHAARWQPDRVRFTTWLYRIAHNLCIDRFRRNGRAVGDGSFDAGSGMTAGMTAGVGSAAGGDAASDIASHVSSDIERAIDEQAIDAAGNVDAEQRKVQVRRALDALPERQRTALALCFYQGFSNQEAAAILDVTVDAVESLLSRARRKLRTDLAEYSQGDCT